ncbi:hypothetical protein ACHAQH_009718 [Verticillium albo-atrum]
MNMRRSGQPQLFTGLCAILGLILHQQAAAQETHTASLMTFFIPDSEPRSLHASLKTVRADPTDSHASVATFEVSCPEDDTPENEACRSAGIYPAEVYHTQGPIWGGTTTYSADDSTTTWECRLEGGLGSDEGILADCVKNITSGSSEWTESTSFGNCYGIAHLLPMVVTAGAQLLPKEYYLTDRETGAPFDAASLNARYGEELEKSGCPASETTMWVGAGAVTGAVTSNGGSDTATATQASEASSEEATGSTGTPSLGPGSGSATSEDVAPTETAESAGKIIPSRESVA